MTWRRGAVVGGGLVTRHLSSRGARGVMESSERGESRAENLASFPGGSCDGPKRGALPVSVCVVFVAVSLPFASLCLLVQRRMTSKYLERHTSSLRYNEPRLPPDDQSCSLSFMEPESPKCDVILLAPSFSFQSKSCDRVGSEMERASFGTFCWRSFLFSKSSISPV